MIRRLITWLFVPRKTRAKMAARGRPPDAGDRDRARKALVEQAMEVYRAQRGVYDSLDEETRRAIEADAAAAFGDAIKRKR